MKNYSDNIGKKIITGKLGVGIITDIQTMGDNGEFYQVQFEGSDLTNFYSVSNEKSFRFISSKDDLNVALTEFKGAPQEFEFESVQDKINFFKRKLKTKNVIELSQILCFMLSENEIHLALKTSFKNALLSFVKEIALVFQLSEDDVWSMIDMEKIEL